MCGLLRNECSMFCVHLVNINAHPIRIMSKKVVDKLTCQSIHLC